MSPTRKKRAGSPREGRGRTGSSRKKSRGPTVLPRSLNIRALLLIVVGLLLVTGYTLSPMTAHGLPKPPDRVFGMVGYVVAFVPYWVAGFAAYAIPVGLFLMAYVLYARVRREKRARYFTRGLMVWVMAVFWAGVLSGVSGKGGVWGGTCGTLFVGAFALPLGKTVGPWAALVALLAVTLHAAGVLPRWDTVGEWLRNVKGDGRRAKPAAAENEKAPGVPEAEKAAGAGVDHRAACEEPGAEPSEPSAEEAARGEEKSSEWSRFPPPDGSDPLEPSILPEPPADPEQLDRMKAKLPEMARKVAETVEEISRVRLEPCLEESHVGLSTVVLIFKKAAGQRRPITDIWSSVADVAMVLGRSHVRVTMDARVRFEMPLNNDERAFVPIRPLLEENPPKGETPTYLLGRVQDRAPYVLDAEEAVHILVAGATGGGKSVLLHAMIFSLVFRYPPSKVWLALADFKGTEFMRYKGLPHLWGPPCRDHGDFDKLVSALWEEMERRKALVSADPAVRLPYLFVFIDEFRGLDTEKLVDVFRLSRAFAMRFVLATQYPNRQTVTREIKTNLKTRIALQVTDKPASQLILGSSAAAQLGGKGDCLISFGELDLARVQAAWVREEKHGASSDFLALTARLQGGTGPPDDETGPSEPVVAKSPAEG